MSSGLVSSDENYRDEVREVISMGGVEACGSLEPSNGRGIVEAGTGRREIPDKGGSVVDSRRYTIREKSSLIHSFQFNK